MSWKERPGGKEENKSQGQSVKGGHVNVSLTNEITAMVQPSGLKKKMRSVIYYESIIRRQVQGWREGWCILGTQMVRQNGKLLEVTST